MTLTTTTNVSVDGVMQGLGGPDEDRSGGFERGGWAIPLLDTETGDYLNQVYGGAARVPLWPADVRDLRRLLGSDGRSEHEPDRRRAKQPAQVRGIDQPRRCTVGGHDCPARRPRQGRR